MTEEGEQIVILNLFQDLLEGPRVKEKRFRNKFGMTRTEEVGMDRPQEPQRRPSARHPELVSGSVGGMRGKGKRFRTKFGMTRTEEVGMDRL